jgi:methyltransferase (TIGR00027 family)
MASDEQQILHVSDTALMVAACRAMETARPDGLVRDPFAERLAGMRGTAIARSIPGLPLMTFGVAIRSYFLDELVAHAIAEHCFETVLCLGCGLDTRPWRVELPADLRWIEVDFPAMLDYKTTLLASEQPKCRLEHIPADLNDATARHAILAAVGKARGLMVTEGLLTYLPAETVEALVVETASISPIRHWLLDLASPDLARRMGVDSYQAVENVRAANHLNGVEILATLRRNGWTTSQWRSYARDAWPIASSRIQAMMGTHRAPKPVEPLPADDPSGVHLFTRR